MFCKHSGPMEERIMSLPKCSKHPVRHLFARACARHAILLSITLLVIVLLASSLAHAQGQWASTSSNMTEARAGHTATLLNNGKVLLAGGSSSIPNYAELYDPATGTFTPTGSMIAIRFGNTATLLNDGRVLIVGGSDGNSSVPLATAELYDPATSTFTATGSMSTPRDGSTATLLNNGKVLIAGGNDGFNSLASVELYDPSTGIFSPTGSMISPRSSPSATQLNNGKVLIVGGSSLATSELYNPATGTFSASGTMATARYGHSATLLNNNKVLILSGFNGISAYLASPELYDVSTGAFTSLTGLTSPFFNHTATLLINGTVLIAGGFDGTNSLSAAQIYDPVSSTFSNTGSMTVGRMSHTATLLDNGEVFVAGGENVVNNGGTFVSSAEVYQPNTLAPPGLVSIAVTPANPSVLGGATQKFVATATFNGGSTQTLGSVIWTSSNTSIAVITNDLSNRGSAYVRALTGSATIRAYAGSICGSTALTVSAGPNIVSMRIATFTVGVAGSFDVMAFGVPSPTFSETGALPSGVTLDSATGLLSGTPARGSGGVYPIILTAQNGVLPNATQAFTLTVNEAPSFTSASSGAFTLGVPGSFTATAYAFPPPTFSESGALPPGVTFNTATSVLSGTPLGAVGGVYVITFTAQNGISPDGTQTFALTVQQLPAITSVAAKGFTLGVPGTFTVTATGVPPPTFSESGALPAGVAFNGATGVLSGIPTTFTTGDYPITFTALNGVPPNATQNFVLSVTNWVSAGSMTTARTEHTATMLNNGKILIAGGLAGNNALASAELYDPATGMFSATGSMATARYFHTATLVNDGKVLIVGGFSPSGIAELYDPATGIFRPSGSLNINRYDHTATLLANGTVLIAGGRDLFNDPGSLASAEVYDPSTETFTAISNMTEQRSEHTATRLNNGKVLIAGGRTSTVSGATYWSSAELYDPATSTFSATGGMSTLRASHVATLLNDGTVLVTGGGNLQTFWLASAELYSPATATFSATGSMATARFEHTQTLLNSGNVLVAGGDGSAGVLSRAELYDAGTRQFTVTDTMLNTRGSPTAKLLSNGKVLVAGGFDGNFVSLASAELYPSRTANPQGLVSIAVTPTNAVIAVGSSAQLTVTGTFNDNSTEQLSSVIWSSSNKQVASVSNDSTNHGVVYMVAPTPSATISACAGSICGSTVVGTPIAPVISSASNAALTAGIFGLFTVTATGNPTPTFLESGTLPSGVSFDTSTGVLAGTPAAGSSGTDNLTFQAQNGIGTDAVQNFTLFIVPAPVISSFTAASPTIPAGSSTTLTAVFSNGTGSVDNSLGAVTSGSPKTVMPTTTTNYTLSVTNVAGTTVTASAAVTVGNPVPTVTSLLPAHADAGTAILSLTVTGTSFVSGAVVNFNGKAETTTFVSASQLTATVSASDNAEGGSRQVTVTNPAPAGGTSAGQPFMADSFTPTISTGIATVTAGQPAKFVIMIAPSVNGFSNSVTLAATGQPQGAQVTFSPNPAVADASVTMTITTTARSSLAPHFDKPFGPLTIRRVLEIISMFVAILVLISSRRRHRCVSLVPAGALLLCLCLIYGCTTGGGNGSTTTGGGSSGTPAGTYNITVTATSGTLVQTTQVTLTVN
jgi:Bacterial Ig-like domain (group 2)/Putative Ig domain/Kelch motif/Galactose oxidase, central domain